jgi:hypothetical protein
VSNQTYSGRCFCGDVAITLTGKPVAMGYCHCSSCRHWSASPVNAFSLWRPDTMKIVKGEDKIGRFQRSELTVRRWCQTCGGHLFAEHPLWNLVDVYAATIPELPFKPGLHVNYGETVLPMADGLPKQRDFPKELGGSGELLPET